MDAEVILAGLTVDRGSLQEASGDVNAPKKLAEDLVSLIKETATLTASMGRNAITVPIFDPNGELESMEFLPALKEVLESKGFVVTSNFNIWTGNPAPVYYPSEVWMITW